MTINHGNKWVHELAVTKVWVNGPKDKPAIRLQLYRNGAALGEPVTLRNGDSQYLWSDVLLTDLEGLPYTYTVDEIDVPKDYTKTVSEDGLTITNTYNPKDPGKKPPKTGQGPEIYYYIGAALLAIIGVYIAIRKKRK